MYDTLLAAVKLAEEYKIRMNLEGLNIKVDHVGNFLQTTQQAAEITRLINSPYLKILYETLKRLGYKYRVGYELFPLKDTATAVKAIFKD